MLFCPDGGKVAEFTHTLRSLYAQKTRAGLLDSCCQGCRAKAPTSHHSLTRRRWEPPLRTVPTPTTLSAHRWFTSTRLPRRIPQPSPCRDAWLCLSLVGATPTEASSRWTTRCKPRIGGTLPGCRGVANLTNGGNKTQRLSQRPAQPPTRPVLLAPMDRSSQGRRSAWTLAVLKF